MKEKDEWLEEEDLPWVETEEDKTPFYADKPIMMIEDFLEHKGVKHLREILEAAGL